VGKRKPKGDYVLEFRDKEHFGDESGWQLYQTFQDLEGRNGAKAKLRLDNLTNPGERRIRNVKTGEVIG